MPRVSMLFGAPSRIELWFVLTVGKSRHDSPGRRGSSRHEKDGSIVELSLDELFLILHLFLHLT